jgi:hypothetical protein
MARLQFSNTLRNARVNQVEATLGTSPKLRILAGVIPANVAAAETGLLLCEMTLPSNWLTSGSSGAVSKSGTWSGVAEAGGIATHFRLLKSDDTVHAQGDVGLSGNVSMVLSQVDLEEGTTVTVTTFVLTDGNG